MVLHKALLVAGFTICLALLASGCASSAPKPAGATGQAAPEISLPTLDGQEVFLSHNKGYVTVLDFWATWCAPCKAALPHLQALASSADLARRGLAVLAVNEEEKPATIRAFLELNHFQVTVVQDTDGSAARAYGAATFPTTIVIGRDGVVKAAIVGWTDDTARQIDQAVNRALDAPASASQKP